ncbi:HAD family hydrolase [Alicyclobacillus acidiphilus]|nr:HAD family hydrolase [Alicyclobacillus acidiphilus]
MIRLIVSDLDGTLLEHDKTIRDMNRAALLDAEEHGCEICLASGRAFPEIKRVMDDLGRTYHAISQNGSFVHTKAGQLLKSSRFEPDVARKIFQFVSEYSFPCYVFCESEIYTPLKTELYSQYEWRIFAACIQSSTILQDIGESIWPSRFALYGDLTELKSMRLKLQERFRGQLNAELSDSDCLDLMPPGVSKGDGLRILMNHFGYRPEEVVCIGDNYNDLSMFSRTPHSFAVSHSPPDVRGRVSHVVDSVHECIRWARELECASSH